MPDMTKAEIIFEELKKHIQIDSKYKEFYIKGIEAGLEKIEPIIIKEYRHRRSMEIHKAMEDFRNS